MNDRTDNEVDNVNNDNEDVMTITNVGYYNDEFQSL